MQDTETVTVYAFHILGQDTEGFEFAPFKTTRETIERRYRGRVLEGTAEEVEISALDEEGRYRRIATGWGVLH